jgi:AcrR family transcriptional regulator/predicted transcriptional regulator
MEMEKQRYLTISELEDITGIPKTTIRYYIREGLISPHIKTGKTMAYYTEEEVKRLELIKRLREKEKMPIKFIKDELASLESEGARPEGRGKSIDRKQEIVHATAILFGQKGYEKVSIQDIVSELQMSKSTFYMYFNNKEELFLECTDYIFHQMFNEVWDGIRQEKDVIPRIIKRGDAFIDAYPKWRDMMNLLRGIAVSNDQAFVERYKESLNYIVQPIIRDIRRAVEQGEIVEDVNAEILGFAFMGIGEYLAELYHVFGKYDRQEILDQIEKILRGLMRTDR